MAIVNERSRGWCFTINNYDKLGDLPDRLFQAFEDDVNCHYAIFGYEVAPTTGTPHIQGYVYYHTMKSFKQMSALTEKKADLRPAKGTAQQNRVYCSKSGTFKEHGEPGEQGKRKDLDQVKALVTETGSIRKVIEADASMQQIKYALAILPYVEQIRTWKPKVVWFWGATGTGKTKAAFNAFPDATLRYRNNGNLKWWDGYDGHPHVIIDDIRVESIRFVELLSLLDRYEYRIENKGGYRQFLAKEIIITCPTAPAAMYWGKDENVAQLLRRIDNIIQFPSEYQMFYQNQIYGIDHESDSSSDDSTGSSPQSVSSESGSHTQLVSSSSSSFGYSQPPGCDSQIK